MDGKPTCLLVHQRQEVDRHKHHALDHNDKRDPWLVNHERDLCEVHGPLKLVTRTCQAAVKASRHTPMWIKDDHSIR